MNDEVTIIVKRTAARKKSIGLEVTEEGKVIVRAPLYATNADINQILAEKKEWIQSTIRKQRFKAEIKKNRPPVEKIKPSELETLGQRALVVIPEKVRYYAQRMGVTYGRITIRNQHTRWGSCSSKGNLNFNVLLMLMPEEVMDYIVVHELCHRKEMNHSRAFYEEVAKVLPNYKVAERWIKEHGQELMERNL
ncbi:MAG: M48 family metallopeptidase [Lachnospiraceae bacterium]|nr:M48 family metallopeptidase [Lachnospiraceae bacterium]